MRQCGASLIGRRPPVSGAHANGPQSSGHPPGVPLVGEGPGLHYKDGTRSNRLPTDRVSLLRCIRAFVAALHERVAGHDGNPGSNLQLPLGMTTDQIVESLLAFDRGMKHADDAEIDDDGTLAEIVGTPRELLESRQGTHGPAPKITRIRQMDTL